jgi:hypothetical protein
MSVAAAVAKRYASDAGSFAKGSASKLEILQSGAGQLAFCTGIQHVEAEVVTRGPWG